MNLVLRLGPEMFDIGLKQNIRKQVIVKVPKARPSPYTFKIQCKSATIMTRMNKDLNRGVDYKVRNRANLSIRVRTRELS